MSEINFSSEMKEALDKENVGDNESDIKDLGETTFCRLCSLAPLITILSFILPPFS